jgi:hypothetical protein
MPTKKRRNKPPPTPTGRSRKPATAGMLERLDADELAAVLRSLLRKHPDPKRDEARRRILGNREQCRTTLSRRFKIEWLLQTRAMWHYSLDPSVA